MAAESSSQKKASTLNPDAPIFQPSWGCITEDFDSECADVPLNLPSSLDDMTEDILDDVESIEPQDLPIEWNVDDFSPAWWNLVATSPSFREYWIQRYEIEEDYFSQELFAEDDVNMLPDELKVEEQKATGTSGYHGFDMSSLVELMKSGCIDKPIPKELPSRYHSKIPQVLTKKVIAHRIQQPR